MGLILMVLVALLALTAGIITTAAARNGLLYSDQTTDEISRLVAEKRRRICEATRVRPHRALH